MEFLNLFFTLLFLSIVIFFWNKYVIEFMINRLEKFHKNHNVTNLDKQPIKFFIQNKHQIIKFAKAFYWIAFIFISIMLVTNFIMN